MAEVQVQEKGGKGGKVRSKKQNTRVDMTPMVDLGFLLITFFMFTTTFSKPNVMDLGLPAKPKKDQPKPPPTEIKLSNSISLLLGKDNRIFWHQQDNTSLTDQNLNETSFDREGIRKVIEQARANAADKTKFTVIIKPTDDAVYKNFVDILDEMAITKSEQYGVTDVKPWELAVYNKKVGNSGAPAAPATK
ncbi:MULTISPECIES: ExbD/TolR family protein [Chryseobacterium]|jgi:biopolymer transport protein ExbD|uniref:Biopolymer transport protein ExbD n=1 Tax=Chryseobacterium rhizosphaerae TaxID=395937 RepID=A0AAE3YEN4_9FLAO|nr:MULTISPECIES: biopolymer transporter ExbD [Chryseobacterium]MBL3548755.1 biopolymer transporter ExbD [Chryseobacterium sp. KMC2]MDC8098362.1 biopolymer transporter ExbD [Chryseobacterium rhizosphaerae]MDR6529057.1 biopolymer transport protein ExbD [Chryseobacterium rhizosphaerae]MDR6546883.1 biopolymer transport protein ExbD [Chryseobacterium rhizosphaerae]REC78819.1 biopolymer transporter ExbD [Chryseobacterium rhizosphaerae]